MSQNRTKKQQHKLSDEIANSFTKEYRGSDLFNNPMVDRARKSMTKEQIEEYERIGKYMYDNVKMETINSSGIVNNNNLTQEMLDGIEYIEASIRSGQHISTLEDNEKMLLKEAYGEKWYEKYNFNEFDINSIN